MALFLVSQGVTQNLSGYVTAQTGGRFRPSRSCRWGPPPRRSRSSSWARTAAASSTPTPRIHSRTHPARQLRRADCHPADLRRPLLHVRQDGGRHPAGLGATGRDERHLRGDDHRRRRQRAGRKPTAHPERRRPGSHRQPGRRQHGGQGGPLRHHRLGPLGQRHDRGLNGVGERDARLVHPARRPGADDQYAATARWSSAASARACTGC